jgi:hypothetical protein
MIWRTGILFFTLLLALGCQPGETEAPQEMPDAAVARAYDRVLTLDEIKAIVPDQASDEDSLILAERYINDWLKEQVMLFNAERNLPEEKKQFERELENYRKTLLTYAYENLFVQQRLDTTISDEEIEAYYEENKDIFSLKDYIVKTKFCVVNEGMPRRKETRLRKLFQSKDPEDLVKLEQFCVDYGAVYYVDIESWMYLEDLLVEIPLEVYNIESFLEDQPTTDFKHAGKHYFVSVIDHKMKDSVSPLDLVREEIRNLILNRRKKEILTQMRDDLYKDAVERGQVEKRIE